MFMEVEQRERYARHILLRDVGAQGQQKLLGSSVLVVGAGGLGAPIIQYLAAAGVGRIGVFDDDIVALSNLQRQVIFRTEDIGRPKVDAAADFAKRLNPDPIIDAQRRLVTDDNALDAIDSFDLIVEGVDNFATRFALNRACIKGRKPLISAAVGRFGGQIAVFKPFDAPGALPCYRCFVPEAPPQDSQFNCAEEGILGAVTGVVGALAAMETLKELLSIGDSLAGKILIYDGLSGGTRLVALRADPACEDCGREKKRQFS